MSLALESAVNNSKEVSSLSLLFIGRCSYFLTIISFVGGVVKMYSQSVAGEIKPSLVASNVASDRELMLSFR